jgi:AraC family transcriptional activator of pobA
MNGTQIVTKNKLEDGLIFKISRFKEIIKKTRPHKHDDYFELIYLSEGEGVHFIESEKFIVSTPEFYLLKPGQLHCWQFTSIPKGYVMLFRPSFFNDIKEPGTISLYKQLFRMYRIGIPPDCEFDVFFKEIHREYSNSSVYSVHIIHGLLRALFAKLLYVSEVHSENLVEPVTLFNRFIDLIIKNSPKIRKIKDFADLLNTTPQNINTACQKYSGKCASDHISSHLILEAKRLLLHTDNTINEIAFQLSFNDASHFVKFFKRMEQITPFQFREKYFH